MRIGVIAYAHMGVFNAYTQLVWSWLTATTRPEPEPETEPERYAVAYEG